MSWAALIVAVAVSGLLGYFLRDIRDRLIALSDQLAAIGHKQDTAKTERPSMSFTSEMNPLEWAALQEKERIKRLNGE
jgi:hypothetical protein